MRLKIQGSSSPASLASRPGVPLSNLTEAVVPRHPEDSSSIIALLIVVALGCAVILASLVTFHCHRWQLRGRKLRRAQSEYEADRRGEGVDGRGPASLPNA